MKQAIQTEIFQQKKLKNKLTEKEKFVLAEIKGVRNKNGAIRITQNEFDKAEEYKEDYFIVVVSNLSKTPQLNVVENPLKNLKFNRKELNSIQVNYHTEYLNW